MTFDKRQAEDFSTPAFNFTLADNVIRPIRAFNENGRMYRQNGLQRSVVIEPADEVHHLQTVKKLSPLMLGNDRPIRAFYTHNRSVAIDADDQSITQLPGSSQKINMPGMQDVEASVSKNNDFSGRLQLLYVRCDLVEGRNHLIMIASRFLLFPRAGPYG